MDISFAACFIYFIYLAVAFGGVRRYRPKRGNSDEASLPAVSVVVAAHNESSHLAELIQCLDRLCYPRNLLQIIIVDDRSTDETRALIERLCKKYTFEYLRIENVSSRYSPKKFALTAGIQAAQNELILVTDADCRPGPKWVRQIVSAFHPACVAVTGFSPVKCCHARLTELLSIDSLANAALSLSGVGWRKPFLTTGRNFAYRKTAFENAGGFAGFEREISGDDDLLLQRLVPYGEVEFVLDAEAHVPSLGGPETVRAWLRQKRRHISASKKYAHGVQLGYLVFHSCNVVLWLSPFWLGQRGLLLLTGKFVADFLFLRYTAARLSWQPRWIFLAGWELMYVIIHTFVGAFAFIGKIRWKE